MAGFIRRFGFFPGNEVITQIEGVVLVDLPPPGAVNGVSTGVACIVGEFADMSYAVSVDGSGAVTTDIRPTQVFSAADMANKFGGWDETIGDFGDSGGNGFVALRSKRYSTLIVSPVNLASDYGCRFFRQLPLCTSQTDSLPVVPVSGGSVSAGREFNNGAGGRIKAAKAVQFTSLDFIARDIEGQTQSGGAATTQVFKSGGAATQVWQYDDSLTTFVDETAGFNDETVANFTPFPAAEAADDYVAVGRATTFGKLTFNNAGGTAGVGGTGTWQYWNGTAWAALTNVSDGTAGFTTAVSDNQTVTFDVPADWAVTSLNSVSAYYVRFLLTGVYATNPIYDQGFVGGVNWSTIPRPEGGQGAKKGDILVIGNNNSGAVQPSAEAGTYRVQTDAVAGINLTIEKLDGGSFTFTNQSSVPWRLHVSSDADSAPVFVVGATVAGGYNASEAGGYSVPVRPLTDATGAATDGVYPAGQALSPLVAPPALTGSSADALSGLGGLTHVTQTLAFDASVQAPNAVSDSTIDALYFTSINATLDDAAPLSTINIIWAARKSNLIRSYLKQNALDASSSSNGRMAIVSPELDVQDSNTVLGDTAPGVGATRDERVIYSWPGAVMSVPEAVNTRLKTADGQTTIDGLLDVSFDSFLASILSNLPPERNPGQAAEPVPTVLSPVLGIQRGVTGLELNDYIALRSRGVAALRLDNTVGPILQSGITSSIVSGEKNISRRRMADFIQDSVSQRLVQFSKLPLTQSNKDSAVGEVQDFLATLQNLGNPAAQRILDFSIDDRSGNTPESEAAGIFVIIGRVRLIPSMDFIVFQTEIGENVVISQDLNAA